MTFQQEKLFWDACFGFVSGHDFSRAVKGLKENWALAPGLFLSGRGLSPVYSCHRVRLEPLG
jgi:hypothetical protein